MNHTSPIVILVNQGALTIKADASVLLQFGGMQSFGDIADLELNIAQINPYATYEPDYWLLDGNYKLAPASGAHVGYMSTVMSGTNTNFTAGPEVRFYFTVNHSTTGLKLYFSEFSGDWTDSITVTFRDAAESVIRSDTYTPNAATFETNQAVSNFRRIDLIFNSTNKAQRYARLTGIDFDDLTIFSGSDVKEARLIEQIDPLAIELPINTLDLKLFSAAGDFSIVNPAGIYANLQYKEPLDVYENINNEIVYVGRFYLDTWESLSENLAEFHASDAIGLLEKIPYLGGWLVSGIDTAGDVIGDMLTAAGIAYEIDASLTDEIIDEWLPVTNVRDALQQFCFAIGGYATCARSDVVQILPFELASDLVAYDYTITATQKGLGQPVNLRPLVTGVELLLHKLVSAPYTEDELTAGKIYEAALSAGNHRIFWDEPRQDYTIAGATIVSEANVNFLDINVATPGGVTISAIFTEKDQTRLIEQHNGSLPAGTVENVIVINDALTATNNNGATVLQRIYDYYQQRYLQKTKLFAHPITVGNSVLIATQSSRQIAGIVEKISIDLAGGFVSDVEIIGVVVPL